jgi:hypothetical protein
MMEIFGRSKLAELIDKYTFLQSLTEKSIYMAQQIFQLRKQIIMALVIYKTIDIVLTALKEQKQLENYLGKKRNSS